MFGGWGIIKELEGSGHGIIEVFLSICLEVMSKSTEVLGLDRGCHSWDSNFAPPSANQVLQLEPTISIWEMSLSLFYTFLLLLFVIRGCVSASSSTLSLSLSECNELCCEPLRSKLLPAVTQTALLVTCCCWWRSLSAWELSAWCVVSGSHLLCTWKQAVI
jgi:hypothetical protein